MRYWGECVVGECGVDCKKGQESGGGGGGGGGEWEGMMVVVVVVGCRLS
jgi:hypothetical protein